MIIGLSGYARSGKDEASRALGTLGYKRVAFADKLREILLALNPIVGYDEDMDYWRVDEVVGVWGWDGYKESPYGDEMRKLMQRLGTECGRELISDSIWVDLALGNRSESLYSNEKLVVTDVRFPNEFLAIKNRGGHMIRIHRPGVVAPNDHSSEHALEEFYNHMDADIINDGSINDLHDKIRRVVSLFDR